jgi:DNA-binding XRE family transcriptional regulator
MAGMGINRKIPNRIAIYVISDIITVKKREMTMSKSKRIKLEKMGWKFGSADKFLELSAEESAYIELKLALSDKLKAKRLSSKLTQAELAKIMHSSQSRVAKMEAGDPAVSIDLLIKSLLALGVSRKELGRSIS